VQRDENLVDLETDKVVLEVPAPAAGVIKEVKVQDGATVTSGQVLAVLEERAVSAAAPAAAKASKAPAESRTPAESKTPAAARVAAEAKASEGPRSAAEPPSAPRAASAGGADKLAPSVRRLVEEHHLDTAGIPGSGRDGRITKADVLTHLTAKESAPPAKSAAATQIAPTGTRAERRVPMTRLRARIAERLLQVQATAAMLTTFNEVDLTQVNGLRGRYKERFEKEHGVRLGFTSFFVKAVHRGVAALSGR
jgi:2-oxoglutarate dehydrogenase E2 component (dihydrolipoamide succinyltransferase)